MAPGSDELFTVEFHVSFTPAALTDDEMASQTCRFIAFSHVLSYLSSTILDFFIFLSSVVVREIQTLRLKMHILACFCILAFKR